MTMFDLKIFFLILIFGKTVILTPTPITIGAEEINIPVNESISAITTGATLQIDVTAMFEPESRLNLIQVRQDAKKLFPKGTIVASLSNGKNSDIKLTYQGGILVNNNSVHLSLGGDIPTETEWNKITIKSDVELLNVTVRWVNAKH
jgi:hypothetical protein